MPPGGVWRYELDGESVESPIYDVALRKVGELMAKHGVAGSAAAELATYMCARMPKWMCSGARKYVDLLLQRESMQNAVPYFSRQLETIDVIQSRMQRCQSCPRHRRDFCLHCTGCDSWIVDGFKGRRPRLPVDDASGCCSLARTFEAVVASVCYTDKDRMWEGVPDTCWRKAP